MVKGSEQRDDSGLLDIAVIEKTPDIKRISVEPVHQLDDDNTILEHLNKIDNKLKEINENIGQLQVNLGGNNAAVRHIQQDINKIHVNDLQRIGGITEGNRTHLYGIEEKIKALDSKIDDIDLKFEAKFNEIIALLKRK